MKFNGDTTLAGSMTATSFIGDGSQLTNLPLLFSYNSNQAGGIEVANYTLQQADQVHLLLVMII